MIPVIKTKINLVDLFLNNFKRKEKFKKMIFKIYFLESHKMTYLQKRLLSKEKINRYDKNNQRHGKWKTFYANGKIEWEADYLLRTALTAWSKHGPSRQPHTILQF